jgi:hypothetical protein
MNNTTENNRLMAEFMGLETGKQLGYDRWVNDWFDNRGVINGQRNEKLLFDSDWNWLMEVVDKIESMDFLLNIRQGHVSIVNNSGKTPFYTESDIVEESKIESVYNTCVEFIKWYNNVDNL